MNYRDLSLLLVAVLAGGSPSPSIAQTTAPPDSVVIVARAGWSGEFRDSLLLRRTGRSVLVGAGYGPRLGYRGLQLEPVAFDSIVMVLIDAFSAPLLRRPNPRDTLSPLIPSDAVTICELGPGATLQIFTARDVRVLGRRCYPRELSDPLEAALSRLALSLPWRSNGQGM